MKVSLFASYCAVVLVIILLMSVLGVCAYGLVLAAKASIVLFVACLIFEPLAFGVGLLAILGHSEICENIVKFFTTHVKS